MGEGKHTPGPWALSQATVDEFEVTAPDPGDPENDWNVALVYGSCGYPEDQSPANARLIAAAPDMLSLLRWLDRKGGLGLDVHERISAAISKAEGRS